MMEMEGAEMRIPPEYGGTAYAEQNLQEDGRSGWHTIPTEDRGAGEPAGERSGRRSDPMPRRRSRPWEQIPPPTTGMSPTAKAYFSGEDFTKRVEEAEAAERKAPALWDAPERFPFRKSGEGSSRGVSPHTAASEAIEKRGSISLFGRTRNTEDILLAGLLILLAREGAEEETLLAIGALLLL